MITKDNKVKEKQVTAQIVAGLLPSDESIEFIGLDTTEEVLWMQHGNVHRWCDLPDRHYNTLWNYYKEDNEARADLGNSGLKLNRQLEIYIYYMCGDVDSTPDLVNGVLNFSENFRKTKNCRSLKWDKKFITIGDVQLTSRELRVIDFMKEEMPDKAIADELINRDGSKGIALSSFDAFKKKLYSKIQVSSRTGLVVKALQNKI